MTMDNATASSAGRIALRGDLLEKRAKLMQAWADYCGRSATAATVTPIRAKKA